MSQVISASLLDAALALPPEARAELADILLDSLPIDPEVVKEIAELAEHRVAMLERGETVAISQEEYLASRRAKWNR